MRKIEFMAWEPSTKRMIEDATYYEACRHDVNPWIYMQYTGLRDKNGKKIFEGYVVKITNLECQIQKAELHGVVVFSHAAFGVKINRVVEWKGYNVEPLEMCWFFNLIDARNYEVIGNIYENPELAAE